MGKTVCYLYAMIDAARADTGFMQAALEEAQLAAQRGEVPVGAVLAIGIRLSRVRGIAPSVIAIRQLTPK